APDLAAAVTEQLRQLALAHAEVAVVVGEHPDDHPGDHVEFLFTANPGAPLLPLSKVASGGELARTMLALRLALMVDDEAAATDGRVDTRTLVFDEVDAGIGGATALAVGRKLAQLARGRQVLCVTHLAQLAAHADAHFVVTKGSRGGGGVRDGGEGVRATVRRLAEPERVTELSRMLSGSVDSVVAAEHAAELLANALADRSSASQ
nr:DNA repair protein RecN [Actinomycetota bacterium]